MNYDVKLPVDDALEQAFREGYNEGFTNGTETALKAEDIRIHEIIQHYGYTAQSDIIIEECAELTQAILKLRRGYSKERIENLCEEVADVLIMARQMRVIFGIELIDNIVNKKLDRQIQRIEDEKKEGKKNDRT